MQHVFMSGIDGRDAYPVAVYMDGRWSISPHFSQDEFSEWLQEQEKPELEAWISEKVIQQYTGNCPGCDEAIAYFPEENSDGRDIMNYECNNCGSSGEIEMVGPEDE